MMAEKVCRKMFEVNKQEVAEAYENGNEELVKRRLWQTLDLANYCGGV